jgi:hypothetical protein
MFNGQEGIPPAMLAWEEEQGRRCGEWEAKEMRDGSEKIGMTERIPVVYGKGRLDGYSR